MSSCLSGGGRAIRLDLEIIKSPSSSWISNSSSSTLTDTSNSPIAISTRKPRTPRKRPNQTYNEAAAILSAAYPKIFSANHLTKPYKFTKPHYNCNNSFPYEPSELFMPFHVFENSGFLLHPPILEKPNFPIEPKGISAFDKPCQSPGEINSGGGSLEICDDYQEDFIAGSILDAEIEEGIDSIMGQLTTGNNSVDDSSTRQMSSWCYGYPIGLGFGGTFGFGMRREVRAMKKVDDGNWWRFPSVNVQDITPKTGKITSEKKKKKIEKAFEPNNSALSKLKSSSIKPNKVNSASKSPKEEAILPKPSAGLSLKLNYDNVLNAWSDKGSPFSGETPSDSEAARHDVQTRLAQIDLFGEDEVRESSVLCDKEKQRKHLFSKKIRYQVRKVNADQRLRTKGRFVRSPNSRESEQEL
ncbi:CHLOROPLAST IMPORT APPARATUS 2-like [Olea europaea subsp. europaea]|uniref:CHLOROPLAST IMPORT APPARATUS 2-like n=1 Tax=Olea europaea subsp. europaea TaxID=158383 RepID=A0A8S0PC43_OLEEU|nr:CHLOROPLAST IMPORT APPARATUS 2-like [Olea europaea subsp. europaea]CAA3002120.1 CHLOROPLAST IMPORT APPARATUS 2-like [Olea europaea subsp. europaea]